MATLPTSPIRSHRTARGSDSTRCTATRVTLSEEMRTLVGMTAIKRELQRASFRRLPSWWAASSFRGDPVVFGCVVASCGELLARCGTW